MQAKTSGIATSRALLPVTVTSCFFLRFASELPPPLLCLAPRFPGAAVPWVKQAPAATCAATRADEPPRPMAVIAWVAGWLPSAPPGRAPASQRAGCPRKVAVDNWVARFRCCTNCLVSSVLGIPKGSRLFKKLLVNISKKSVPWLLSKQSL